MLGGPGAGTVRRQLRLGRHRLPPPAGAWNTPGCTARVVYTGSWSGWIEDEARPVADRLTHSAPSCRAAPAPRAAPPACRARTSLPRSVPVRCVRGCSASTTSARAIARVSSIGWRGSATSDRAHSTARAAVASTSQASSTRPMASASSVVGISPPTSRRSARCGPTTRRSSRWMPSGTTRPDLRFVQADAERPRGVGRTRHHAVVAAQREHAAARRCVSGERRGHWHGTGGDGARRAEEGFPCMHAARRARSPSDMR